MSSRAETIERMNKAKDLHSKGQSVASIAKILKRSESRIREYIEGVNWTSKTRTKKKIK